MPRTRLEFQGIAPSVILLQGIFRAKAIPVTIMAFSLNPFDRDLNLTDKDDRKLFKDGCKGLKEENKFDGKRESYVNFMKLIKVGLESIKAMECLMIGTAWVVTSPQPSQLLDLFENKNIKKEQIKEHCDLVWANTDHASTPRYFRTFTAPTVAPTDDATLNDARNQRKLRHVMMGNKIWSSLKSKYQLEILPNVDEFKYQGEFDGVKLLQHMRDHVNPSTTIGSANMKDEVESKNLSKFGQNIGQYHTWLLDAKARIERDEGKGKYNEYLRSMFKTYETCNNKEFREAIKDERRKWITGRLKQDYDLKDLIETANLMYNNEVATNNWEYSQVESSTSKQKSEDRFVALNATVEELKLQIAGKRSGGGGGRSGANSGAGDPNRKRGEMPPWRFVNEKNEKTMIKDDHTFGWCDNDCHRQRPMWCGRPNCLNKADFRAKKKSEEDGQKVETGSNAGKADFKIALAAMMSPDDFETVQKQFGGFMGN